MKVQSVNACRVSGNDKLAFVTLVSTFSAEVREPDMTYQSKQGMDLGQQSILAVRSDDRTLDDEVAPTWRDASVGLMATGTTTVYELWVRIFPDDIAVQTHEPALTNSEIKSGGIFWQATNTAFGNETLKRGAWRALTAPVCAWSVHALALWLWHIPVFFRAALADPSLHVLQHTCFFVSAFAFWWAVFGGRAPDATGLACLFTTMLHTSALAVLLTFAPAPWYAHDSTIPFGLTALEDQQLGGLVMWVPGAFAYVVAGLAIVAGWLRHTRAQRDVS